MALRGYLFLMTILLVYHVLDLGAVQAPEIGIREHRTRCPGEIRNSKFNRIPSDPRADLLSCSVNLIGDSGHNSGQGCSAPR
jgi:hypothetical protein